MSSAAPDVDLTSTITCPSCHAATEATMPTGRCQFFWDCPACEAVLRPKEDDCCVFCSYGSVPCPSMQQPGGANACCAD